MNRSIVGRLVAKDLHLYRWLIAAALIAGIGSLALSRIVPGDDAATGLNVGFLLFVTTIIAFGVFVAMAGILKERQDRSQLFVLSLPVSPAQYSIAKVTAAFAAFLGPWLVLTGGVVLLTAISADARGYLPFFVAMMTFFLANFCVLMAVVVITLSERWSIAGILVTNTVVPVFLAWLSHLPGVAGHRADAAATWSPAILAVLAGECAVIALSLGLALVIPSRKKDVV